MVPSPVRRLPSTNPASKQRRTISSKTSRNTPAPRNRPCRFLEKVEWSGISRSNPSRLNQRYAKCIRTSSIKRLSLVIPYISQPFPDESEIDEAIETFQEMIIGDLIFQPKII